jgi:hypothetical protein
MEYHSDRFEDYSLMIFRGNKLCGILPAHTNKNGVASHLGLTYGGLIGYSASTNLMEDLLTAVIAYLRKHGMEQLSMKIMPSFLQQNYSSALEYFLFHQGGELHRRDLNYVVDLRNPLALHKSKLKKLNAIDRDQLSIEETSQLDGFWNDVLIPVLKESHGVAPVHTLAEIQLLRDTFPKHIVQYNVEEEGRIIAGMTLFIDNGVVKSQYGAAVGRGKEMRALDLLYLDLFKKYKAEGFSHFDMGTTTVDGGTNYNLGLTKYKEEFGATPVNLDHYSVNL